MDVGAEGGPTDLLDAATRELAELLGERGTWTLLGERPRSNRFVLGSRDRGSRRKLDHGEELAEAARGGTIVTLADGVSLAVPLSDGGCCVGVVVVTSQHPRSVSDTARATAALVARLTAVLLRRTADWQRLPAASVEAFRSGPVANSTRKAAGAGRRVLLVEDDAATADALVDALEDEDYVVVRASDGGEGVARAISTRPDLILFDVNLPVLDGFAAAAQVRAAETTQETPIIFLSARPDLSEQVRARHLENVDFLPKPFSGNELLTRIEQAFIDARARHDLQQRAAVDELTGLGNLRMFRARLGQERERFARYGTPLSLAMIDVDKLKLINDQHGHLAGSEALRAIADVLRCEARATDVVARYGGDEMVVLLPDTILSDAFHFAERVRSAIARLTVHGFHPTVSIGVAALRPGSRRRTTAAGPRRQRRLHRQEVGREPNRCRRRAQWAGMKASPPPRRRARGTS